MTDPTTTDRHCANGTRCHGYDHIAKHPAWTDPSVPLCDPCLAFAARDVHTLLYDWVDLAQLQAPSLSQAINPQPGARRDPPMPLRAEPDALQREIHHVVTTWETEVRHAAGQPDLPALAQHGAAVQRAVAYLEVRLRTLATIPPTAVYPSGCEDTVTDMAGWEAIAQMQRLRARARGMLGWTHRSRWVPGDCWNCDGRDADPDDGPLYRPEPRWADDEVCVYCARCGQHRRETDYDTYLLTLSWSGQPDPAGSAPAPAAEPVEVAP